MLEARWQGGDNATQAEIDEALQIWRPRLSYRATPEEEWFDIVDEMGHELGLQAPRWFAHLTGLRHRVVHVLLTTPQGLLALQMRSHRRPDWPERISTTVAGHVKAGESWEQGAFSEIQEEIGLRVEDRYRWLAETVLKRVGEPYAGPRRVEHHPHLLQGLPMVDRQVNQIFTGTITAWGLATLRFDDGEVDGIYLASPDEVARLVRNRDQRLAPNLFTVFERWQNAMK